MSTRPYMKFYIGDFEADTIQLSNEEVGAYLRLLMVQWTSPTDSIPNDDRLLMRILRCTPKQLRRLKPTMLGFFKAQPDGCLKQGRVSLERLRVDRVASQNSANSLKRWRVDNADASNHSHINKKDAGARARGKACAPAPLPGTLSGLLNRFPSAARPINAETLSPEQLAKAEAEALDFIKRKP